MNGQTTTRTDKTCLVLPNLLDPTSMIVITWEAEYSGINYAKDYKEGIKKQVTELVRGIILHQIMPWESLLSWRVLIPWKKFSSELTKKPDTLKMEDMILHAFSKHKKMDYVQKSSLELKCLKIEVLDMEDRDKEKKFEVYQFTGGSKKFSNDVYAYKNRQFAKQAAGMTFLIFLIAWLDLASLLSSFINANPVTCVIKNCNDPTKVIVGELHMSYQAPPKKTETCSVATEQRCQVNDSTASTNTTRE